MTLKGFSMTYTFNSLEHLEVLNKIKAIQIKLYFVNKPLNFLYILEISDFTTIYRNFLVLT